MLQRFKEQVAASRIWQYIVFVFIAWAGIWNIIEPLNISWITDHLLVWRLMLLAAALLIGAVQFMLATSRTLETIEVGGGSKSLDESYVSIGQPQLSVKVDDKNGAVVAVRGDFEKDSMDWALKSSAQKAKRVEFTYAHVNRFCFYLRVVVQKAGTGHTSKWIRFDNTIGGVEGNPTEEEMALPVDAKNKEHFLLCSIDIAEAVKRTFGQIGWEYARVMIFRVRGEGEIKSIRFK